jgi:bifunctional non-homologous end joining protein LigD
LSLKEYHRKRDFSRTQEPAGLKKLSESTQHLFVVQKHAASHLHYDFRLELEGVLKSWAVPKGPSLDPKVKHLAMHVEDHPVEYAFFEGTIPQGEYGGGTVMIWDIGKWQPLDENPVQAYHKGDLNFVLLGKKLNGRWKLIRLKKQTQKNKTAWLLFKVNDDYSHPETEYGITTEKPLSAVSKRSMEQIADDNDRIWTKEGEVKSTSKTKSRLNLSLKNLVGVRKTLMPAAITPELATLVVMPPRSDDWLHEIKWDGYRLITKIHAREIRLMTRRNKDWTKQFPSIVTALRAGKFNDIVLDGEVVALDENNKTNFQVLQNSMEDESLQANLIYYVFDILYINGFDLQNVPLIKRKEILAKIFQHKNLSPEIKYNDHVVGKGDEVFKHACDLQLEGIISKRINSRYVQKRTREWLKAKCIRRQEFIVGGFTDPKSSRQHFGALLLGYYDQNKKLIYCGRVGTGFTQASLKEVGSILKTYQQPENPFNYFPERITKDIHWVRPSLVAEIEYLEMTSDGILRHPSFKGLRQDKNPKNVILEIPREASAMDSKDVSSKPKENSRFTNLSRVFYPEQGITKQNLLDYYELVADWILPHIKDRPLTLVRCPSGNHENCFYQKHMNERVPKGIKKIPITEHGKAEPYIYLDSLEGLQGLVQLSVLEIHPWGSTIENIEYPDRIIFDLDPAPDVEWDEVVQCAKLLREFLNFLELKSYVKTTGGKGLHIVIPIMPTLSWKEVRNITKRMADLIVELKPQKYIATMSKTKRKGKIFIDYIRNTRGSTAIGAYSTRAKSEATIAVPLTWEELDSNIRSDTFNVLNIKERLNRLKKDPWVGFFKTKQSLNDKLVKKLLGQ